MQGRPLIRATVSAMTTVGLWSAFGVTGRAPAKDSVATPLAPWDLMGSRSGPTPRDRAVPYSIDTQTTSSREPTSVPPALRVTSSTATTESGATAVPPTGDGLGSGPRDAGADEATAREGVG